MEAALAVLVLLSILVGTVYATAMAAFRSGVTDVGKLRTYYAAEAGAESAMAQLAGALEDVILEDQELTMISAPSLTQFAFDSFSIQKVGGVRPERITDGHFAGLYSLTQNVEIYSEASDPAGNSSAVIVDAKAQAIPIFQFGVFYEKDLEIHNGPRLDFGGWVHSNGSIYLSSANQYFQDLVTTPNKVFHDRKDRHAVLNGVYIDDASGTDVQLTFDSRSITDPDVFKATSEADFDGRLKTDAHGVDTLNVPLPIGMDPLTIIQPRQVADGPLERQAKFAWKADWNIEIPINSIANPANLCDRMVSTRSPGMVAPTVAECQAIFRLEYDGWYEGRERRYVDVVDVDMNALFTWTGVDSTRVTNILYFTVTGAGPDPEGDGNYPVVRLLNGANLLNPITVSTVHPLYVQGHYNAGFWQPAALVGDAITFLSPVWSDAAHAGATVIRTAAANTNVYAAVLAGHSGTSCDHEAPGCGLAVPYGGGLENFPRFLEDWNGRTLLYRGSLVSLSYAQQPIGLWGGAYYRPPRRDWQFDTRFEIPANLPPGTPMVGNLVHTAFRPVN